MFILANLRVRLLFLFVLAALVQPMLCLAGTQPCADAATPLWTQNTQGEFIIVNTSNGKYQVAPHQFQPDPIDRSVPYSFAYDSFRDRLWILANVYGDTITNPPKPPTTYLGWLNPHTGASQLERPFGSGFYSLTYRPSDGLLYALLVTGMQTQAEYFVMVINPDTGWVNYVCQIQPKTIGWSPNGGETPLPGGTYFVSNTPPRTLVFDPVSDQAYLGIADGSDGFELTLDLQTGTTHVVDFAPDPLYQTFAPNSHLLYSASGNGPVWVLAHQNMQNGKADGYILAPFPPAPIAFVPHGAGH